jgi:hypothetical protein
MAAQAQKEMQQNAFNGMEFAMTEKIVRSETAHSVTTSEITKNAINPRNSFIDQEKPALEDPAIEIAASVMKDKTAAVFQESAPHDHGKTPDYPSITDHFDTRSKLAEVKKHIHDNRQKLVLENPQDNEKFFESLQKIEDRISTLRQKHPKDNHQGTGAVAQSVDNIQPLDQVSYNDHILYREKKNLMTNVQRVREGVARDSVKRQLDEKSLDAEESVSALPPLQTALLGDEIHLDEAQLLLNGELGAFDENELRAKVKKMQEKLIRVNQTLKDIENEKPPT